MNSGGVIMMTRTQISFDTALYKAAQAEARRRGISLAELCRQALRGVLEAEASAGASTTGKPWMKYSGAIVGEANESDNRNIDATVYGAVR